eukprot:NODE_361_length_10144_cov_0.288402.p5 type:complete len:123 gc:universal NODE_361_length_10144_cov_0.288402:6954-7322(+)
MTYATLSPRFGALPASLSFIFFAHSTCGCLFSYSSLLNCFVITNKLMSTLFCNKSEIIDFAYSTAPLGSAFIKIKSRHVSITLLTNWQLSLRTVSMPLASILSYLSGRVQFSPAYLFLFISK